MAAQPVKYTPKRKFSGYVLSFEPLIKFGRRMPTPWKKWYECSAYTADEAHVLLHRMARNDGYGLDGVRDIKPNKVKEKN